MKPKQKENEAIAFDAIVCNYINIKLSSRYGKLNKNAPNSSREEKKHTQTRRE